MVNRLIKQRELLQIRRFLNMGAPVAEICRSLHISRSKYFRYFNEIYKEDKEMIQKRSYENTVVGLQIFYDRLGRSIMIATKIEENDQVPELIRLQATRVKLETSWAQIMLQVEGPRILAQFPKKLEQMARGELDTMTAISMSLPKASSAATTPPVTTATTTTESESESEEE